VPEVVADGGGKFAGDVRLPKIPDVAVEEHEGCSIKTLAAGIQSASPCIRHYRYTEMSRFLFCE
jgi:hypothetical protein